MPRLAKSLDHRIPKKGQWQRGSEKEQEKTRGDECSPLISHHDPTKMTFHQGEKIAPWATGSQSVSDEFLCKAAAAAAVFRRRVTLVNYLDLFNI